MIERSNKNFQKYRVTEHTIGCERCHGPGEGHVAYYQDGVATNQRDQIAISSPSVGEGKLFHPGKATREKSERFVSSVISKESCK